MFKSACAPTDNWKSNKIVRNDSPQFGDESFHFTSAGPSCCFSEQEPQVSPHDATLWFCWPLATGGAS